ncbi:MAG: HEAT repeat domain-containing protein [Lentisphaerota bacterium]
MTSIIPFLIMILVLWLLVTRLNLPEPGTTAYKTVSSPFMDGLLRFLYTLNVITRGRRTDPARDAAAMAAAKNASPEEALHSKDRNTRRAAAQELGNRKDAASVPALIEALHDEDNTVRDMAARSLAEIKEPSAIIPMIQSLTSDFEGHIEQAIVRMGSVAVEPLVSAMESLDSRIREKATFILKRIQEPLAIESLLAGLGDESAESRVHASWELRNVLRVKKDPGVIDPLIASLNDENTDVRSNAAEALGELKDPRAVEPLTQLLRDPSLSRAAAWALGEIKDSRAVPSLIQSLGSENQGIRENAASALSHIGAVAVEPMMASLKTGSAEARQSGAWALGEIKDHRAMPLLMELLKDEDMLVRAKALEALGSIASPLSYDAIHSMTRDGKPLVRAKAIQALALLHNPESTKTMIEALHDDNNFVRESAAEALGDLGNPRAIEPLIEALADDRSGSMSKALAKLSGVSHSSQSQWREWWSANKALIHRSH